MEYKCINEPIPVTNNNHNIDNWSNKNPKPIVVSCSEIQSKSGIEIAVFATEICPKKYNDRAKDTTIANVPVIPATDFPIRFPKNILIKKPTNGVKTRANAKKLVFIKLSF